MLVLSVGNIRTTFQEARPMAIGNDIRLKVWIESGHIKIGIDAPKQVVILRPEIVERIDRERAGY